MRQSAFILLLSSVIAMPAAGLAQRSAAAAQGAQAPTVDDYVCTFSGDCGSNAATNNDDPNAPRPRISATRGFALSGTEQHSAAPTHRAGPPQLHRTARNLAVSSSSSSSSAAAPPPASGPGQRINLAVTFVTGSAELTPAARAGAAGFGETLILPHQSNISLDI
jgi:hypothetical protein